MKSKSKNISISKLEIEGKIKNGKKIITEKSFLAASVVILLSIVAFHLTLYYISKSIEKDCIQHLNEGVQISAEALENEFENMNSKLFAIADIIEKSEEAKIYSLKEIYSYGLSEGLLDFINENHVKMLMADNKVLTFDGHEYTDYYDLSFEDELKKGIHISECTEVISQETNKSEKAVRYFIPIKKDGKVIGMLFSEMYGRDLTKILKNVSIYDKSANLFVVDRNNGSFIINSKENKISNLNDSQIHNVRGNKDANEVVSDILSGNSGNCIYKTDQSDEDQYMCYTATKIGSWSILESVPESIAMKQLKIINFAFGTMIAFEMIIFIIYTAWIIINSRGTIEKAVLEERLKKAKEADRAKTMFLSNMSHDIRTPMNAIIGYTTLAATNIDNKERVQEYHSKILSSSNHLLSLINDILDMSRIESGKVYIEETECTLPEVIHDLRNIIINQIHSKKLNLFIDTFDVTDEDVYCDKLHLNQVLLNLLTNAIKFTPEGGSISLSITQKPGAPAGYGKYEIRVKDTGIGMSPEFAKHVFEPFEREHTSTVSGIQGTGLGMAISKNIVDMMGGTIAVETEQGKGTEFIIDLELKIQNEKRQQGVIKELEGLRALVVDDEFSICDSVTKMLTQIGMRVQWTMSGKEAVLHAKQANELADDFYVYIIDWQLPDINGVEVARQIRKAVGENVPIIVITAYDWSAIEDEAREAGVTAFCNKPIFMSTLRDTLLSAIGKNEKKEEKFVNDIADEAKGRRILLVEDNELNSEIASELLTECGFIVETAEDGSVAVEKVSNAADDYYDLVLMDIQMPVMNGYEAARAIRKLDNPKLSQIPIIAMTANAFAEDKKAAIDAGMNTHIAKPIDINVLLETITKYLEK